MTTEEKAKAYDEALERLKPLYEQAKKDGNPIWSTYEYLVPELRREEKPLTPFQQCLNCILRGVYYAEVPDKKVNEFILNVVRTRTDELVKLAKRHEHTDCQLSESEDERIRKKCIELIKRVIPSGDSQSQESKEILDCIAYLEEQKPALNGEDERIRKEIIEVLRFVPSSMWEQAKTNYERCSAYLEKQKEKKFDFKLIKQAWYMEGYKDREFGKESRWIIKTGEGGPEYEENPKYGQPLAKEQKPAEWSEEDEKQLDDIISIIREAYEHGITISEIRHRNAYFWLNNLRPSWKPSEEQMKVLDEAFMKSDNEKYRQAISSLYYDLKKL